MPAKKQRHGSKKERLNSHKSRVEQSKLGDVTLSEFADSDVPKGQGRLRKSKHFLQEVSKISTSKDITFDTVDTENEDNEQVEANAPGDTEGKAVEGSGIIKNIQYPLKIWLLLADYIAPEDILSFSLICRDTYSVVNTPFFWIRLYKRYYNRRYYEVPKCLSPRMLQYHLGLKQKVVRSLYYFYPPLIEVSEKYSPQIESLVGRFCCRAWVVGSSDHKVSTGQTWTTYFKFTKTNCSTLFFQNRTRPFIPDDINYNRESGCCILKVVQKDFVKYSNIIGMRLISVKSYPVSSTVVLTFGYVVPSWRPVITNTRELLLTCYVRPRIIPWWHPDYYWQHCGDNNCNCKRPRKGFFSSKYA